MLTLITVHQRQRCTVLISMIIRTVKLICLACPLEAG